MKKIFVLLGLSTAILFTACADEKDRYVDLRTGETITVEKDKETGAWLNAETKKPVYIYVDTKKNDTIYGKTGTSINGKVVKSDDGVFWYTEDEDYKVTLTGPTDVNTDGEYKKKVEGDGDIKIKDGDTKIKIDGETGEKKVKND